MPVVFLSKGNPHGFREDFKVSMLDQVHHKPLASNPCFMLRCVQLFVTPWTVARQASLSTQSPRREYWSGLPFPPPGDLPDPEMEPRDGTHDSCRQILYHLAIWEAQGILITTPQISTYKSIFAYQWFGKIFGGWEAVMNYKEFHPS